MRAHQSTGVLDEAVVDELPDVDDDWICASGNHDGLVHHFGITTHRAALARLPVRAASAAIVLADETCKPVVGENFMLNNEGKTDEEEPPRDEYPQETTVASLSSAAKA